MTEVVIHVEHLSKYYRLGLIGGGSLREDVNRWIVKIKGRVGSLLEVSTGFHSELTWRENTDSDAALAPDARAVQAWLKARFPGAAHAA